MKRPMDPQSIVVAVVDERKCCGKSTVIAEIEKLLRARAPYKVVKSCVVDGEMAVFTLPEDIK